MGFPDTYAELDTGLLIEAFAAAPDRLCRAVAGLDEEDLRARPRAGKWSIIEIVAHVTDSEIIGAGRIRQVFAGPGSSFAYYDQELWAERLGYQGLDGHGLLLTLDLFRLLRWATLPILQRAEAADWRRQGFHPELGEVTLRQLLELYADHSERHLEQILALRRLLGRPLDLPSRLAERLY